MFNHHFFDGEVSVKLAHVKFPVFAERFHVLKPLLLQASGAVLQAFLAEGDGQKAVMVSDPPFGGLVKPLAHSFSLISQTWRKLQASGEQIDGYCISIIQFSLFV